MSEIYYDFKKEECGLCAYYGSKRETSRGFFGNSIKVSDEKAFCSETGRETTCNRWCNRFARCGQAEVFLQEYETRKEEKRLKDENAKAMALLQEEQRKNEAQAAAMRREADRLEEQNRIAAMTAKEKREYFDKKKREEEQNKIEHERWEKKYREEQKEKQKNKRIIITLTVLIGILFLILAIVGLVNKNLVLFGISCPIILIACIVFIKALC